MRTACISVEKLSAPFGAAISGVDLAHPLDATHADLIREALWCHGLLVFHRQQMTASSLRRLLHEMGLINNVQLPPTSQLISDPDSLALQTDALWKAQPPLATLLYAESVLPASDSIFASRQLAYTALSRGMQIYLSEVCAIHDAAALWAIQGTLTNMDLARMISLRRNCPLQCHALRRDHPITGAACLGFSANLTTQIEGVAEEESQAILQMLREVMSRPELQTRINWQSGTLVIWDNFVMEHHAVGALGQAGTTMLQMEIGEPQISVDPVGSFVRIC